MAGTEVWSAPGLQSSGAAAASLPGSCRISGSDYAPWISEWVPFSYAGKRRAVGLHDDILRHTSVWVWLALR